MQLLFEIFNIFNGFSVISLYITTFTATLSGILIVITKNPIVSVLYLISFFSTTCLSFILFNKLYDFSLISLCISIFLVILINRLHKDPQILINLLHRSLLVLWQVIHGVNTVQVDPVIYITFNNAPIVDTTL